jgi:phage FluMu gp28-like protein
VTRPALELYPYQRRWFMDRARFKIGMLARQTGKTFVTTAEIVDDCYEEMTRGKRTRWVILSRGERQAREAMIEGVQTHARAYNVALEAMEYDFEGGSGARYRALECAFANGSRITALPANPDTARGFSANVFLDEFAFHLDSRAIWRALFPVISAGWKLRVVSTPNGKGNKFYELMTAGGGQEAGSGPRDSAETNPRTGSAATGRENDPWSRHRVDIHQAVAEGLRRDIEELRRALGDEDAWAQEYELQWLDEASAWLDYELISSVEHDGAGRPDLHTGQPVFIGNDIARRGDLWVAWVLEPVGDVLWTREIVELRRATFAAQDAVMDELFGRYDVARLCMDQTGMGEKPVEDAARRYGGHRVEGVIFTGPAKLVMATAAKEAFEDRRIRIPGGNPALRADLHSLRKSVSATGAPRFVVEDEGQKSHADRAWSCFLAIHAAGIERPRWRPIGAAGPRPAAGPDDGFIPAGAVS